MSENMDMSERVAAEREQVRREIEEEIKTLDQQIAAVLHPDLVDVKPLATLVFGPPQSDSHSKPDASMIARYEKAVEAAKDAPKYWVEGDGKYLRHHARFGIEQSAALFALYELISDLPENDVLIYDLPMPFARNLWLPLFWFHRAR